MKKRGLDQVTNLGSDGVPDTIQRGVEDSAEQLDGEIKESVGRPGVRRSEVVRTVKENQVVAILNDAVIKRRPLVHVGNVLEDSGGLAGEGEGGEIGRHRQIA